MYIYLAVSKIVEMVTDMELPPSMDRLVDEKGGIAGITRGLPNDRVFETESKVFHALSSPLRLKILSLLNDQPLCVCLIKEVLGIPDSKLSYHLSTLMDNGLIEGKREASWIIYNVTPLGRRFDISEK